MSITYPKVQQEILNVLGAVKGGTPTTAEANYSTTPDVTTVSGPDFLASQVLDAIVVTQGEIVEAIASTPLHPERNRFSDVTGDLANRDEMPRVGQGGLTIIGVPGFVRDSSDGFACDPAPLDAVRSYTRFAASTYNGQDAYLYCINGGRIEHTRTNVVVEVCVYERPTVLNGAIDLDDHHEGGLIQGAIAKLALKESMFSELNAAANRAREAHLAQIRSYGNSDLYGKATAAPSST